MCGKEALSLNTSRKPGEEKDKCLHTCFVRLVDSAFKALMAHAGEDGIYIEPRSPDGRLQDEKFQTIWLTKQSLMEAKATKSIIEVEAAMVRMNDRYGIKVRTEDAAKVHAKLHPEQPFVPSGARLTFRVGPWPWGTTKKGMEAIFRSWDWNARALQPAGRSECGGGLMWVVHASGKPSSMVYTMSHGDVVVFHEDAEKKQSWKSPQVQASSSMRQKMQEQHGILMNDPWADAANKLPSKHPRDGATPSMAAIEAAIDQRIASRMSESRPEADVDMSEHEPRFQAIEAQMQQLQTAQQAMMKQASVCEQKVDFLHQQVEQQGQVFAQTMDNKLSEQMVRIEALINANKQARKE